MRCANKSALWATGFCVLFLHPKTKIHLKGGRKMAGFVTELTKAKALGNLNYLRAIVADAGDAANTKDALTPYFNAALEEAANAVDFMNFMQHLYSELDD